MSAPASKLNLHERLSKHSFDNAMITTFTFGTRFFEDYALETFKSLQQNQNISIFVDEGEYREILKSAAGDRDSFPKRANLHYLLHPIRVPGVFHPKVFLFTSKNRGLLVVGSANFTQDGLGSNAEMVATFNFEEGKSEETLPLFQQALEFFEKLAVRWPSEQLRSNLNALIDDTPWLSQKSGERAAGVPELITNLDEALWDQLLRRLPRQAENVSVLSRFYDASPALVEHVTKSSGSKKLTLFTQNGVTTLTKDWLGVPAFAAGDLEIRLCRYADEEHYQQLHGKAYGFSVGKEVVLAMGSANFTQAALRRTATNGNMEVLLVYPPIPASKLKLKEWFDPQGSSVRLRTADQLQSALENTDEDAAPPVSYSVRLDSAIVEDEWLILSSSSPLPEGLFCRIIQAEYRPIVIPTEPAGLGRLRCRLDEGLQSKLRKAPAIAQLGTFIAEAWTERSALSLVANIVDSDSGRDLRRERQIKEARQSPQKFISVLNALANGDDEERLKQFLTYCDIPIDLPVRLFRRPAGPGGPPSPPPASFSMSGARHLRHFELLHEAAMDFARRHHRRLERHVERGTAKGVGNFLHILLTVCGLIVSQIERLAAAMEAEDKLEIVPDRWRQVRDNLDDYYSELEKLLHVTAVDYLDALIDGSSLAKFQAEFAEQMPEILSVFDRMKKCRARLVDLQKSRLVVLTNAGPVQNPGFFSCTLSAGKWPAFEKRVSQLQAILRTKLAI
jgi:hypothetical protein